MPVRFCRRCDAPEAGTAAPASTASLTFRFLERGPRLGECRLGALRPLGRRLRLGPGAGGAALRLVGVASRLLGGAALGAGVGIGALQLGAQPRDRLGALALSALVR